MSRIVFLDLETTYRNDLNLEQLHACGNLITHQTTTPEQVQTHIGDAEIVITNKVVIDASTIQSIHQQVKLICIAATGTNNVDLEAASAFNIPVTNVRDYGTQSVAEHVISLIFSLNRSIPAYQQAINTGQWQKSQQFCLLDYPIREVSGLKLCIVGYGVLGQATARLAKALGMQILIAEQPNKSPREGRLKFEEALAQADIVSLHCPLTEETKHLIDTQAFEIMKSDAILINTARGGIVHEQALVEALTSGKIAAAATDVLTQEPPTQGNILLEKSLPNLMVTPHIAWASQTARQTLVDQLVSIIKTFQEDPQHIMNRVV